MNKYVIFNIKTTSKEGNFEVNRCYSDFQILRKCFTKRWPGCFIPSIPEKKSLVKNYK